MSKQKKAKKDRRPNISPVVNVNVAQGQGGGAAMASTPATVDRKATAGRFPAGCRFAPRAT